MDQLIPGLVELVAPLRDCFRSEVFQTFQVLLAGWIVCIGPHTISGVWQATGLAAKRHHDTAYAVFHSAAWEWDDLGIVLATVILATDPRWRRLDRRQRHPLPQARGQGRLRRHLPRPGPLVEAAQDLPLRPQLRRAGDRRADPDADGPLLVPVGALAAVPQEGPARPSDPPPGRRRAGPQAGRGRPGPGLLAGRRQRLCQRGFAGRSPGEPGGDRAVALEGGLVRAARPLLRQAGGPRRAGGCRRPRR